MKYYLNGDIRFIQEDKLLMDNPKSFFTSRE